LPFFKAYDLTDQQMEKFSAQNILLIADTQQLFAMYNHCFIFYCEHSYEHYIRAVCKTVDFPYKNTYCTKLASINAGLLLKKKNC